MIVEGLLVNLLLIGKSTLFILTKCGEKHQVICIRSEISFDGASIGLIGASSAKFTGCVCPFAPCLSVTHFFAINEGSFVPHKKNSGPKTLASLLL
jgi:hypothetical protein